EDVDALGAGLSAGLGQLLGPLLACDTEADERPDLRAELDRLVLAEVAQVLDLEFALRVLVDRERVDHAHGVALAQPLELGNHLAVEVRFDEAEHDQLYRS